MTKFSITKSDKNYQIDMSGKIEQTNKITVIAFSNGKKGSIKLSAKDKRYLQDIYRQAGKPKSYVLQVFSALLYTLLAKFKLEKTTITFDTEYPGYDDLIKSYLIQLCLKKGGIKLNSDELKFGFVGKASNAHSIASKGFRVNRADFSISKEEILGLILLYEK